MELLLLTALSKGIQKVVDFARNLFDERDEAPPWVWNLVPFVLGIAATFGLEVDLGQVSDLLQGASDTAIRIAGGLVAGGLASGWHELEDLVSKTGKAKQTEARALAAKAGTPPS